MDCEEAQGHIITNPALSRIDHSQSKNVYSETEHISMVQHERHKHMRHTPFFKSVELKVLLRGVRHVSVTTNTHWHICGSLGRGISGCEWPIDLDSMEIQYICIYHGMLTVN